MLSVFAGSTKINKQNSNTLYITFFFFPLKTKVFIKKKRKLNNGKLKKKNSQATTKIS